MEPKVYAYGWHEARWMAKTDAQRRAAEQRRRGGTGRFVSGEDIEILYNNLASYKARKPD